MRSLRSFSGMPVILSTTGKRIARAKNAQVNRELTVLDGICAAGRFGKTVFFAKENITCVGEIAVIVSSCGEKKPKGQKFRMRRAMNTVGEPVGAVTDLYVDEERFFISCAELTFGVFEDIARGRKLVRRFHVKENTGEIVIHEEGEKEDEEGHDPRYDRGNDCGRVGCDNLRHDELAAGEKNGTGCDECRKGNLR